MPFLWSFPPGPLQHDYAKNNPNMPMPLWTNERCPMPKSLTISVLCYIIIKWSGERGPKGIDKQKKSINENVNENHISMSLSVSIRNCNISNIANKWNWLNYSLVSSQTRQMAEKNDETWNYILRFIVLSSSS